MKISSSGITEGMIHDIYGAKGTDFNENGMALRSLPIKISDYPEETVCFALVMEDKDACPVSGFSWIHWLAANITTDELEEDASRKRQDFIQGVNSWISIQGGEQSPEASSCYGGMAPPDAPHLYETHIFALDAKLPLENGFYMNELYKAMEGHILDHGTLKGIYTNG